MRVRVRLLLLRSVGAPLGLQQLMELARGDGQSVETVAAGVAAGQPVRGAGPAEPAASAHRGRGGGGDAADPTTAHRTQAEHAGQTDQHGEEEVEQERGEGGREKQVKLVTLIGQQCSSAERRKERVGER